MALRPAQPIGARRLTHYAKEVKALAAARVGILPGHRVNRPLRNGFCNVDSSAWAGFISGMLFL